MPHIRPRNFPCPIPCPAPPPKQGCRLDGPLCQSRNAANRQKKWAKLAKVGRQFWGGGGLPPPPPRADNIRHCREGPGAKGWPQGGTRSSALCRGFPAAIIGCGGGRADGVVHPDMTGNVCVGGGGVRCGGVHSSGAKGLWCPRATKGPRHTPIQWPAVGQCRCTTPALWAGVHGGRSGQCRGMPRMGRATGQHPFPSALWEECP